MPLRRLFALLAAAIALAITAGPIMPGASAHDFVSNGGFEHGTAGWHGANLTTFDSVGADVVAPVEGTRSARAVLSGHSFTIRQGSHVGAVRGTYEFRASVRTVSDQTRVAVRLLASGSVQLADIEVTRASNEWITVSTHVHLTGYDEVTVVIAGVGAPGDVVFVDDVRLGGAAPATMTATATLTPLPSATGTRTPTPTRTPTATPTVFAMTSALQNAGFEDVGEDGTIIGWRKYGGTLSSATSPVRSGSRSARLESRSASTKWLYQPVSVAGETWYEFSAWVWQSDPAVASAFLRVSWYESSDASGRAIATDDSTSRLDQREAQFRWLTTGPIAAPATARSASLRIMLAPVSSAPATIFVDDAWFERAGPPPPESVPNNTVEGVSQSGSAGGTTRASRASRASAGEPLTIGSASGDIVINEVLYDSIGEWPDADGEWVELYNRGDVAVDVAGWTLEDNRSSDVLPTLIIEPGGFGVVASTNRFFEAHADFRGPVVVLRGRIGNGLGNAGDRLYLKSPDGAVVDAISWGDDATVFDPPIPGVPAGHSIERAPAGRDTGRASDFVDNHSPTPGWGLEVGPDGAVVRDTRRGTIDLIAAPEGRPWLVWTLVGASVGALAVASGWRAYPLVRRYFDWI
jgi:hypothetical protein